MRSVEGDSSVDIPSFLKPSGRLTGLTRGTDYQAGEAGSSLSLLHYWDFSSQRPYVFISQQRAGSIAKITYSLDEDTVGVISGYEDGLAKRAFYAACRTAKKVMYCIEISWDTAEQAQTEPIVDRISRSMIGGR